jgi:hypothetical protein
VRGIEVRAQPGKKRPRDVVVVVLIDQSATQ